MKPNELVDLVDWENVMKAPRYAGGHKEVMVALFRDAEIIACFEGEGWDGTVAYAYRLKDGSVILTTDGYGSCSGCDAWEDCPDDDARELVRRLAADSHWFPSVATAVLWIKEFAGGAENYQERELPRLLPTLEGLVK